MNLDSALEAIREAGIPASVRQFSTKLNAEWVASALTETGTLSVRRRRLPARVVVWLVIAMALFRDCAIRTVARRPESKPLCKSCGPWSRMTP